MKDKKLEDYHFYVAMRTSREEMRRRPDVVQSMMMSQLRERLSAFALDKLHKEMRVEQTTDYYVEHKLDVYVIPPDVLYWMIEQEAQRIARMYSAI